MQPPDIDKGPCWLQAHKAATARDMKTVLILLLLSLGASLLLNTVWLAGRTFAQQQRPQPRLHTASAFLREWAAALWMIVGMPLALLPHGPRPALRELDGHPPVLLIPGYALTRVMMWPLATYLRYRGRWVWAINNPIFEDDLPTFAAHARDAADELRRQSGADQIDIIGHSMGGLVAAWYIQHLGGAAHVRRLVTLGTPWAGTMMAIFSLGRQGRSLRPDSAVVESLDGFQHDTVAIWSQEDCVVLPTSSAVPAHARAVEVADVGHLDLLQNASVMRAVRDALGAAPS